MVSHCECGTELLMSMRPCGSNKGTRTRPSDIVPPPCCSSLIRFSPVSAHPSNYLSTCRPLSIATLLYCYSLQAGQTWHADLWPLETFHAKRKTATPFLPVVLGVIDRHCFPLRHAYLHELKGGQWQFAVAKFHSLNPTSGYLQRQKREKRLTWKLTLI